MYIYSDWLLRLLVMQTQRYRTGAGGRSKYEEFLSRLSTLSSYFRTILRYLRQQKLEVLNLGPIGILFLVCHAGDVAKSVTWERKPGSPDGIPCVMEQRCCKLTSSHCMTLQSLGAEGYTEYRRNGEREYSCWVQDIQRVQITAE